MSKQITLVSDCCKALMFDEDIECCPECDGAICPECFEHCMIEEIEEIK